MSNFKEETMRCKYLLTTILFVTSSSAFSSDDFYAGISFGQSNLSIDAGSSEILESINTDIAANESLESALIMQGYAGYNFSDTYSIEVGMTQFGDYSSMRTYSAKGYITTNIGLLPVNVSGSSQNRLSVESLFTRVKMNVWTSYKSTGYARAGLHFWNSETNFSDLATIGNPAYGLSYRELNSDVQTDDGIGLNLAIGMSYQLDVMEIFAEADFSNIAEQSVTGLRAGVEFSF